MRILGAKEFLERLNVGKLNIRDIKLPESRLLPDELVSKYKLAFNKITGRYDCNDNIKVKKDLVKDGKLIADFGVVKGDFSCHTNELTSLEGCPTKVGGSFICIDNQLTSLEGSPTEVGGSFYCSFNQLTSLEDCPSKVGRDFYCNNNELTSLEGCPAKVDGKFDCSNNNLTTLEDCPAKVSGNFDCSSQKNDHKFTVNEVKSFCDVKQKIYV